MVAGVLNNDPHPFLAFLFLDLIHKVHKQLREKGGWGVGRWEGWGVGRWEGGGEVEFNQSVQLLF